MQKCFVIEAAAAPFQSDQTAQYYNKTVYDWNVMNTLRQKPLRNGGKVAKEKTNISDGMTMCNTENTLYSFLNTTNSLYNFKTELCYLKIYIILIYIFSV